MAAPTDSPNDDRNNNSYRPSAFFKWPARKPKTTPMPLHGQANTNKTEDDSLVESMGKMSMNKDMNKNKIIQKGNMINSGNIMNKKQDQNRNQNRNPNQGQNQNANMNKPRAESS